VSCPGVTITTAATRKNPTHDTGRPYAMPV
jgi:hypothetical protein